MNHYTLLMVLGSSIALIPHLGFPGSWKTALFTLFGVAVVGVAYMAQRVHAPLRASTAEEESVLPSPEELV
jgi:cbb3-type cytochrome oxidase subunit 3